MCLACGFYNGRQVMDLASEKAKREARMQAKREVISAEAGVPAEPEPMPSQPEKDEKEPARDKEKAAHGEASDRKRDDSTPTAL